MLRTKLLQNEQTQIANGDVIRLDVGNTLRVGISGTSTSFTIGFYGNLDGTSQYYPIEGTKCNDSSVVGTTTSTLNEVWEFDISGWYLFQARITAIGNGNVSAYATLV